MKWLQSKSPFEQMLMVMAAPLVIIQLLSVILWVTVSTRASLIAQFLLTTIWLLLAFIFIVKSSKPRWPEATAFQRLSNIITFKN
jgi:uncharacterized membrane protein YobD (UPF0266 family)